MMTALVWILIGSLGLNLLWIEREIGRMKRDSLCLGLLGLLIGPFILAFYGRIRRSLRYLILGDFTTKQILLAKDLAVHCHRRQVRKYTGEPYSNHPIAVAKIVSKYTHDETAIATAYLHDSVEDTSVTYEQLLELFTKRIADTIAEVTNPIFAPDISRNVKLELVISKYRSATLTAKLVKMADILDNIKNIARLDPMFAQIYLAEKEALLPYLREGCPELHDKVIKYIQDNRDILVKMGKLA